MTQAGYPNGFKTSIILQATEVDYYSIIKDQWSKVGIDVSFDVKDPGVMQNILNARSHDALIVAAQPPPGSWPEMAMLQAPTQSNCSMIDDPKVNAAIAAWNVVAISDEDAAMKMTKELMKYVLPQAWAIPTLRYPTYVLWWPWIKNYDGETNVGWNHPGWARWVWLDQDLQKSMGH